MVITPPSLHECEGVGVGMGVGVGVNVGVGMSGQVLLYALDTCKVHDDQCCVHACPGAPEQASHLSNTTNRLRTIARTEAQVTVQSRSDLRERGKLFWC